MDVSRRIVSIITNQLIEKGPLRTNENKKPVSFADAILLASQLQKAKNAQTVNDSKNQDMFVSHDGNIN